MGSDLLFPWAPLGIRPTQILRGIASGVLGPKSFYGGWPTAMLGATLHFLIAFSAASVFYGASRKPIFLTQRPVLSGALYGIVVYLFMYWVVLPLSAYHKSPFSIILTARLDDRWWPSERTLMSTPLTRRLGAHEIPAIGMGCWAIGGPFWFGTQPLGWGEVDDNESIAAIHKALDLGVSFFDTANIYGCGHSERVLGTALKGVREQVIIATKFGNTFDESTRQKTGQDASPEGVRRACDESLQRLGATYIDLYQFHLNDYDPEKAVEVLETLEELVTAGKIRSYGWSTDFPGRAEVFAKGRGNVAVQHELSIFCDAPEMLRFCEERSLASVNRSPLAMGLLTGKFDERSRLSSNDVRGIQPEWLRYFDHGQPKPEWLTRVAAIREILTSDGRTLTQGALAWIWARSPQTIPIPGFRTVKQIEENIAALRFGPLSDAAVQEIAGLLAV